MQYIVALIVPVIILVLFRASITSPKTGVIYALISSVGMYATSIATVFVISSILDFHLAAFDLSHDGYFDAIEQTQAQQSAMDLVTNDVGRNLTFILAIPWSLFVSFTIFISIGFWRL